MLFPETSDLCLSQRRIGRSRFHTRKDPVPPPGCPGPAGPDPACAHLRGDSWDRVPRTQGPAALGPVHGSPATRSSPDPRRPGSPPGAGGPRATVCRGARWSAAARASLSRDRTQGPVLWPDSTRLSQQRTLWPTTARVHTDSAPSGHCLRTVTFGVKKAGVSRLTDAENTTKKPTRLQVC